ncbi:PACE efflux transporter [Limimaricola pyoseonensis]|uniref:Uncharacterized membrane protein n=1 Tax=Limimaricola pyoseonensis TaxID=521013 RepID=A0A1G7I3A6_9RHOB|nr:PACE efflux transporter [Limimaricola pyoseonensis]SDF07240.1 Uncharacterized membrane protein [Limimaricola pyoseonensis]
MRSKADRIRQALSFEIIGLAIVTPAGAWLFGMPVFDIGLVSLIAATVATGWNYVFNLGFDHALKWARGSTAKSLPLRVLHAISFEAGLLVLLLPVFAWWLGVGLAQAFTMELSFALFYVLYAFAFTWCYDRVFPDPDAAEAARVPA